MNVEFLPKAYSEIFQRICSSLLVTPEATRED